MTIYCAVPGCNSNSKTTDYTFHRFPRNVMSRARWILALRRPVCLLGRCAQVCGRHFEERMFSERGPGARGLVKNAVPTLFLPSKTQQSTLSSDGQEKDPGLKTIMFLESKALRNQLQSKLRKVVKIRPNITRRSEDVESSVELVACRVCLAAGGRLYAISGSGLEDLFLELSGAALSLKEGFPRHLCAFCRARLSQCAAFRDSCQRSTALLQTLLDKGPLTLNDIKSLDRKANNLTNNLAQTKAYHFQTNPYLDILSEFENEDKPLVPDYTEVEYLESDDGVEYNEEYLDIDYSVNDIKVEIEEEIPDTHSDAEDYTETKMESESDIGTDTSEEILATLKKAKRKRIEKKNESAIKRPKIYTKTKINIYASDIDTDTSDEIIELRKKVEIKKLSMADSSPRRIGTEEFPHKESISAFEKEFNCKVKLLSKEEQKQEVEERKRNNKSAYCCDLCGKGYNNEKTIMTHLNYHDPSLPHGCEVCGLRFRSRHALTKHRHGHRAVFTCNQCGHVSRNRTYAKDHSLMHKGNSYTCPYCHVVYNHQTSYYNHIRVQHPGQNEACDECGETFAAGRGLRMHKALAHKRNDKPDTSLICPVCYVMFVSAEALQRHSELSEGVSHDALFPCGACGDSCGSDAARAAHTQEKHPPDQHYCEECDKTFSSAAVFALHVDRKHKNRRAAEAPFRPRPGAGPGPRCICEICGKVVKNSTLLQYHLNGHLAVKPFQCLHCPKAFPYQGALNLHLRVHTGERPYQCEQCPRAFASPSNLIRHNKLKHSQQRLIAACTAGRKRRRPSKPAQDNEC